MIIAVDFDDTIRINGKPNIQLIEKLNINRARGDILIFNTCRQGKRLKDAVSFCSKYGLIFHAINDNVSYVVRRFGYNPRKIYADIYIDDKAARP